MAKMDDFDKKAFLAERKKMSIEAYERIMAICQKMKKQMKKQQEKPDS